MLLTTDETLLAAKSQAFSKGESRRIPPPKIFVRAKKSHIAEKPEEEKNPSSNTTTINIHAELSRLASEHNLSADDWAESFLAVYVSCIPEAET